MSFFEDLDCLTIFANNLIPHVLRVDQVLHHKNSPTSRINAGKLAPSGPAEEVEIRGVAVHAIELLVEELLRAGQNVTALELDYFLWNRGQQPFYKAHPRHRTRTGFY